MFLYLNQILIVIALNTCTCRSCFDKTCTFILYVVVVVCIVIQQSYGFFIPDTLYHFGDNDRDAWDRLFSRYNLPPYHIPGLEAVLSFGLAGQYMSIMYSRRVYFACHQLNRMKINQTIHGTITLYVVAYPVFLTVEYVNKMHQNIPMHYTGSIHVTGRDCSVIEACTKMKINALFFFSLSLHSSLSPSGPGTGVPFHIHGPTFAETIFGRKVCSLNVLFKFVNRIKLRDSTVCITCTSTDYISPEVVPVSS